MTFEDLRVFLAVAAERSFSRAARKLHRTQPAVSQAIRRLEQDAGERLIDRSSRDGTLTALEARLPVLHQPRQERCEREPAHELHRCRSCSAAAQPRIPSFAAASTTSTSASR